MTWIETTLLELEPLNTHPGYYERITTTTTTTTITKAFSFGFYM
jgi:hypothetical protein